MYMYHTDESTGRLFKGAARVQMKSTYDLQNVANTDAK